MKQKSTNTSTHTEHETEPKSTQSTTRTCDECGGRLRDDESQGEVICEGCGLVISDDAIDHGPEWRAFTSRGRREKSRVGPPVTNTIHDKGLSTNISWQDKDAYGNTISERKRQKMGRLRKWNKRFKARDSADRTLKSALTEIQRMASALGLHKQTRETAGILYQRCQEENMMSGRRIESMAAACLYAASRQCNTPRTLKQVHKVSRINDEIKNSNGKSNKINRAYCYISEQLNLELEPVDPQKYLNRYMSEIEPAIESPEEIIGTAKQVLKSAERENYHSGKAPSCLAASAIYASGILCDQKIPQHEVAEASDISEMTIRNQYTSLLDAHKEP